MICLTASWTAGILVEPPTNNTLSMSFASMPASFIAILTGSVVFSTKSWVSSLNFALLKSMFKWSGPAAVAEMNGKLMFVVIVVESSFLAFSAASFNLCKLILSWVKSTPFSFLKFSAI